MRFISDSSNLFYDQIIQLNAGFAKFDVPITPGAYTVQASGFIDGTTVYAVEAPTSFTVAADGSSILELTTRKGANLDVHPFPNFLSFGALSDLVDMEGTDFVKAQASSLFKYAGNDGAGDSGVYLDDDQATLGSDHPVLPVMISYTINLSGGGIEEHLQDADSHAHSFGNLILSMNLAKEYGKNDVLAGYILNPDFLGECEKGPDGNGYAASYAMPVRQPLMDALAHWKVDVTLPDSITDTLKRYVLAVNWLLRVVGTGGDAAPAEMAKKTADYLKTLGLDVGEFAPDFLAVDRYEADDFTQRGYTKGYCYGPYEWGRFFDFCRTVSFELEVPVMPWQMPASRIPNKQEEVSDLENEHWGTDGT
ncbi:hypothetical protein GGR53DRAFT_470878 [Hypoxylon sp. FL1150]|nr:hypothetical protein GGR53DRAFT_470878 [Hypoxylon sp. FL1150]